MRTSFLLYVIAEDMKRGKSNSIAAARAKYAICVTCENVCDGLRGVLNSFMIASINRELNAGEKIVNEFCQFLFFNIIFKRSPSKIMFFRIQIYREVKHSSG